MHKVGYAQVSWQKSIDLLVGLQHKFSMRIIEASSHLAKSLLDTHGLHLGSIGGVMRHRKVTSAEGLCGRGQVEVPLAEHRAAWLL